MEFLAFGKKIVSCTQRSAKINGEQFRRFSVKELPWCSPPLPRENIKKKIWSTITKPSKCISCSKPSPTSTDENTPNFGIIAAFEEKSRIIGIDGKLPWHIPEDREYFERVTLNKVLIVGKKTFNETSDFSHLSHLRHVIVVSSTMQEDELVEIRGLQNDVKVARTFQEALQFAKSLVLGYDKEQQQTDSLIWIGGGQLLYEKALRHPNAIELRLTTVHAKSDIDVAANPQRVALFPAKYRWDNNFKEISQKKGRNQTIGIDFTFYIYQRRR